MLTREKLAQAQARAREYLDRAGIVLTPEESKNIEVADFGLGELEVTGLELVVCVNTVRVCAKELVLFPGQTCPEHRHPTINSVPGKEETFRCRWGNVYLYVSGPPTRNPACRPPAGSEAYYTVFHEIFLKPGDQHTIFPDTLHWFQAGPKGAVVSEFSTRNTDDVDIFTDIRIKRLPEVA